MRPPATPRGILASALAALTVGVGVLTLIVGWVGSEPAVHTVQVLAVFGLGVIVIGGAAMFALVHLADWRAPEDEFEMIVQRTERIAAEEEWETGDEDLGWDDDTEYFDFSDEEEFKQLVHSVLDELPLEFHRALEHVALVVSDGGARVRVGRGRRAVYGMYQGDTVTEDYFRDRIVIFKDTLIRDFGRDPDRLREQVLRTVRVELARHLGVDEHGVDDHS